MHQTQLMKALSITLLLSCTADLLAMNKKKGNAAQTAKANIAAIKEKEQVAQKQVVQPAGPTGTEQFAKVKKGSPEKQSPLAAAVANAPLIEAEALTESAFVEERAITPPVEKLKSAASNDELTNAVEELIEAQKNFENSNNNLPAAKIAALEMAVVPTADAQVITSIPASIQNKKSLLGKELDEVLKVDNTKLVQQGWLKSTDATGEYKDEARLLKGLESNDSTYLNDVQAGQDLTRNLKHICAGFIQKAKEQSSVDKETDKRKFTVEQMEAIINSQHPRIMVLFKILTLCNDRAQKKLQPTLRPQEDAMKLAQSCFTAFSQIQLERKRIRQEEENNRIRQVKEGQRLAFSIRLDPDKGSISDDEYSDAFIFEKTTE